jgi:hypothetical protein
MNKLVLPLVASAFLIWLPAPGPAQDTSVTLAVDTKPALVLKAPAAKVVSSNGYVKIAATNMTLHIWAVPGAKTAADALPRAAEIIKGEFINFKPTATNDLEVAGSPAKQVTGSGNEADDQDPGNAVVVLFAAGGRAFAACVHGEFDDAFAARAPMLAALRTAHAPP